MATLNPRRFADITTLRQLSAGDLQRFLAPHATYLAGRGLVVPDQIDPEAFNYLALAGILVNPTDEMPNDLCSGLYFVNEMATQEAFDLLIENLAVRAMLPPDRLAAVDDDSDETTPLSPADVALRVWLEDPDLLEQLHAEHDLPKVRSFEYYHTDRDTLPAFKTPSAAKITALTTALDDWFQENRRGRGAKVILAERDGVTWFLIRHGETWRREGCLKDNESSGVVYRPEVYDVLVYNSRIGEIGIHCRCSSPKWSSMYRTMIGKHIFGDAEFFPGTGKYTLEPLRAAGVASLAVDDIDGIDRITLTELHLAFPSAFNEVVIRKADDIFAAQEARKRGLLIHRKARIVRARFLVKFSDVRKPRIVTIRPSNMAQYVQDDDSVLVERWLAARSFLTRKAPAVADEAGAADEDDAA